MATILRRRGLGMSSAKGIAQFSEEGIGWCRNDKDVPLDSVYFRWGTTSNLPKPCKVINYAKAIHRVADKLNFRLLLSDSGLCQLTVDNFKDAYNLEYPVILRPRHHSQGKHVIVLNTRGELLAQARRFPEGWYASSYIRKVAEYRVFVVSGRVVCVAEKTPANKDDIAWNVAKGGRFDVVRWGNWDLRAVKASLQAHALSGLDFSGVDVMVDGDGEVYVLEINSAPSLTSPYRQACMAKGFDYIVKNGTDPIPLVDRLGDYKKFIHPAVCDRALLRGEV